MFGVDEGNVVGGVVPNETNCDAKSYPVVADSKVDINVKDVLMSLVCLDEIVFSIPRTEQVVQV